MYICFKTALSGQAKGLQPPHPCAKNGGEPRARHEYVIAIHMHFSYRAISPHTPIADKGEAASAHSLGATFPFLFFAT